LTVAQFTRKEAKFNDSRLCNTSVTNKIAGHKELLFDGGGSSSNIYAKLETDFQFCNL
jgi:hypothetical protein